MTASSLDRLLAGTLADPDGPGLLSVATRQVVIAPSLRGQEPDLLKAPGLGARRLVVSDPRTREALGARVAASLGAGGQATELVLADRPHADAQTEERVRAVAAASGADAIVAVGSGTINDLCKLAAHRLGKPYVVFATAPSMNGYTSVSAAITENGHKKSLPAAAALAAYFDLEVLSKAPARMIRAGLGDSICRPTAQADWLLAHLLLDQPYRRAPFALLAEDEMPLLRQPEDLMAGSIDCMRRLVRTLVLSGFGMTICGGSYPASQGEHLISHYLDMMGSPDWPEALHGEHIAVTTLTMARIQDAMLAGPSPELGPTAETPEALEAHFGPELGRSCWLGLAAKALDAARARRLSERLARDWPDLRAAIAAVMLPPGQIADVLRRAGAPTTPRDLGIPAADYRRAVTHARTIRDRFTFLDLAAEARQLDRLAAP